jgi:fumarate hydratase subunit alpha
MKIKQRDIREAVRDCLIKAGTTYRADQLDAYRKAVASETLENPRWVLEQILENAKIAEREQLPLCDDTGIPHVIVRIGDDCNLPQAWLAAIQKGLAQGLREMPGRPMAVAGDDIQRVEQSIGLHTDPAALEPAPVIVRPGPGDQMQLTVLLLGGGPEIRAKTRRVFHRRSIDYVLDEVAAWFTQEVGSLGCTPTVAAVGIGRSQVEASALMLEAMAEGSLDRQNELEKKITAAINQTHVGPIGMGGNTTALGCFLKIGPTRASGVRIVSARPCCIVEPRRATVMLG